MLFRDDLCGTTSQVTHSGKYIFHWWMLNFNRMDDIFLLLFFFFNFSHPFLNYPHFSSSPVLPPSPSMAAVFMSTTSGTPTVARDPTSSRNTPEKCSCMSKSPQSAASTVWNRASPSLMLNQFNQFVLNPKNQTVRIDFKKLIVNWFWINFKMILRIDRILSWFSNYLFFLKIWLGWKLVQIWLIELIL